MENLNDNNQTFFRFEDLRVYHKALNYVEWVHMNTALFPEHEMQNLTAKFVNATQAIALQIAEGSSRNKTQFVYYLKMAKSSIRECVVYTAIARGLNYITEEHFEESRNHLMELTKMIGALIGSLQRSNNFDED
ncbi:MAG TPA: four helix bundle protein [Bacteroidales bacterium]|nr:four helix bundle protein [Bacteroidales bacterium]HPR58493.1 four helix bundle protein [Bacteroidales bacterium]HRW95911.1 four helix bundle protein [Bacteroidales bacterium]